MDRGNELNLCAVALLEFEHGRDGQGSQVKVFVLVLAPRIRADDNTVVIAALLRRFMNHLVGGLFGKGAVKAEEFPGHFLVVPVAPVGNIADIGYGQAPGVSLSSLLAAIVRFNNQTGLPPFFL